MESFFIIIIKLIVASTIQGPYVSRYHRNDNILEQVQEYKSLVWSWPIRIKNSATLWREEIELFSSHYRFCASDQKMNVVVHL